MKAYMRTGIGLLQTAQNMNTKQNNENKVRGSIDSLQQANANWKAWAKAALSNDRLLPLGQELFLWNYSRMLTITGYFYSLASFNSTCALNKREKLNQTTTALSLQSHDHKPQKLLEVLWHSQGQVLI